MTDLVDLLRQRLAAAIDPICCCPDLDVTSAEAYRRNEREFIKGYADTCPIHGLDGTEPIYRRAVRP